MNPLAVQHQGGSMVRSSFTLLRIALLALCTATACAAARTPAASPPASAPAGSAASAAPQAPAAPAKVTIAYQPGIGYANLIVIKQQKALEREFPNTQFEWKILASGSAIRDGMIANQIQVGAGGVGPFLIGWDRGVGWKLLSSLNEMDLWLVVRDPAIQSLRDFRPEHKIAMPAPDSIQAMVLRKAAQEQLGNPRALDNNIVAMAHPEGVQALAAGQITGHLTSPPFQFEEVQAGGRAIVKSFDYFGKSTFNSVYMLQSFYDQYPQFAQTFYRLLVEATQLINTNIDEAARLLSEDQEGRVSAEQFKAWMTAEGVSYSTVPRGFLKYAEFMKSIGFMTKAPTSIRELVLPTLDSGD
jgi:NitT/TauT family transport system substrate-binding protein